MHLFETKMHSNNDSLILNIFHSNKSENKKSVKKVKNISKTNEKSVKQKDNNFRQKIQSNDTKRDSFDKRSVREDRHRGGYDRRERHSRSDKRFSYAKLNSNLFDSTSQQIPTISLVDTKSLSEPVFSSHKYTEMSLHPYLIKCLDDRLSISQTTAVQQNAIPVLMKGSDGLIKSVTGSGKTLAFAIPIVQDLQSIEPQITRSDGIHALIIVPTRELTLQCNEFFAVLCQSFKRLVTGYLCGGEKKKSEKARIRKGINILVSTPGRLLDHMQSTGNLNLSRVKWFVIDEADRLLEQGYEDSVQKIVEHLKNVCFSRPQIVLLSATLTDSVQRLAGMTLTDPQVIDISDHNLHSIALPENLIQHYLVVAPKLRLITLSALLMDKCCLVESKALVFMSSQDVIDFHYMLFNNVFNKLLEKSNQKPIHFYQLHGNMDHPMRRRVFNQFRDAKSGVLLCTDVAARGLDLTAVDWIIQYTCAQSTEDFVHRVGRTARIGKSGNAVQFVLTTETKYLELLQKELKINFNEIKLNVCLKALMFLKYSNRRLNTEEEYASQLQTSYEDSVNGDNDLMALAKRAYLSYIRSYATYPKAVTDVLPFKSLHLGHMAKSFALQESPKALGAFGYRLKQQSIELQHKYNNYNKRIHYSYEKTLNSDGGVEPEGNHTSEPAPKRARYDLPSEMRTSEFGGQLVTKQKHKLLTKKH